MPSIDAVQILVNPPITPEQLFAFYERNHVCEVGYGQEIASRVLTRSSLIVGAFEGDTLVGLARALCDGVGHYGVLYGLGVSGCPAQLWEWLAD